jgi:hypothetical protein
MSTVNWTNDRANIFLYGPETYEEIRWLCRGMYEATGDPEWGLMAIGEKIEAERLFARRLNIAAEIYIRMKLGEKPYIIAEDREFQQRHGISRSTAFRIVVEVDDWCFAQWPFMARL